MKVLVFSFGGGTHDVTVMEFGQGVFEVLATSGDTQTGGADIDRAIVNLLLDDFKTKTGIDLRNDQTAMARLKEAAERAKIELSNVITTDVDLPFIASDRSGAKNLHYQLTRAKLEELARPHRGQDTGPDQEGHLGRQARGQGHRQGHPDRRDDQDAARSKDGGGRHGQTRGTRRRPHGGGGVGRGHTGGRPRRRGQGHPAAGRDPAHAGRRDQGGHHDAHRRAQLYHPHREDPDLHHGRGLPDGRHHPRRAGREEDGRGQHLTRDVQPYRTTPGAAQTSRRSR